MITLTDNAIEKIAEILAEENDLNKTLRIFVQGGGCSGMSYGFAIEDDKNEDDFEIPAGSRTILVDSISVQYVTGATVDYVEDLMGASFKISNPNAQTTCGCGSSFSPY
jgi:iron-sulfur cluster insertion protein